jgi:hypothetical protein
VQQKRLIPEEHLVEPSADELSALTQAVELLVAPGLEQRREGLQRLREAALHRRSALASALLARGIEESNLSLRKESVVAIAEVVAGAAASPPEVIDWLRHTLGQMRRREIYGLLQVAAASTGHAGLVHLVLDQCSFSGGTLVRILQDRSVDIQIRVAAARAIEALGYLDAAPAVAVLENRIASRVAGQEQMGFAPSLEAEAELLLPALNDLSRALQEASL